MKRQRINIRKALCSLAAVCLFTFASAISNATTINFDEFPANNVNVSITTLYNYLGVTFGSDNSGTWGGNSKGNPGYWGLEGTNGSAFLGNNGQNNAYTYVTTISFNTSVTSFSFDVSRSIGSIVGQSLTWYAYEGSDLRGFATIIMGDINSWSAVNLNFAGNDFDKIVLDGFDGPSAVPDQRYPYGIDNLQFSVVPEPVTLWLLGAGLIGLAGINRRFPR